MENRASFDAFDAACRGRMRKEGGRFFFFLADSGSVERHGDPRGGDKGAGPAGRGL